LQFTGPSPANKGSQPGICLPSGGLASHTTRLGAFDIFARNGHPTVVHPTRAAELPLVRSLSASIHPLHPPTSASNAVFPPAREFPSTLSESAPWKFDTPGNPRVLPAPLRLSNGMTPFDAWGSPDLLLEFCPLVFPLVVLFAADLVFSPPSALCVGCCPSRLAPYGLRGELPAGFGASRRRNPPAAFGPVLRCLARSAARRRGARLR